MQARDLLSETDPLLADALKIVANSTSYGIWAEIDLEEGERAVTAFGTNSRHAFIQHGEKPGSFYSPIIAALIAAGGRHMLGVLEAEIAKVGGVTLFGDTDSLAVVSSEKGGTVQFEDHRGQVVELPVIPWKQVDEAIQRLDALNPYDWGRPLIKLEPQNFEDENPAKPRVDLYGYTIAAKRYGLVLPSQEPGQLPRVVKASYHTLGIVEPPRDAQGVEIEKWIEQLWAYIPGGLPFNPPWADQFVEFQLAINRPEIRRSFGKIRARNVPETGNKRLNKHLRAVKPFSKVAALQKSRQNAFVVENVDESADLKDIPVIAPVAPPGNVSERRWVAKNSGRPVYLLPPDPTMDVEERQAIRESIEAGGRLVATPMTFRELIAEYRRHHESKALDAYGLDTTGETRGQLTYPRVRITEIVFTGKETTLQDELERGLVSELQAASDRVLIPPARNEDAALAIQALRLLSKADLKRLGLSRRAADHVKAEESAPGARNDPRPTAHIDAIGAFLQEQYPDEVEGATAPDQVHSFTMNRTRLLERWNAVKLKLQELTTKQVMTIAGCLAGTAKNIKYGRTEPRIETIKKLVNELARTDIMPPEGEAWPKPKDGSPRKRRRD